MSGNGCCLGCGLPYGWQLVHNGLYRLGDQATVREDRDTRTWTIWTREHGVVEGFDDATTAMLATNEALDSSSFLVAVTG